MNPTIVEVCHAKKKQKNMNSDNIKGIPLVAIYHPSLMCLSNIIYMILT